METLWFAIIVGMLAIYVVLDGFDFGVGILHRFVARTDQERRIVLSAIGPVWDGNEVWLIAAGGVLFMAFPKVYATAFSGFYMALMIVLWLLILRGVSMEFRSLQQNPLWREFWDSIFSLASGSLAFVFGAALGNLVRGVPIDESGLPSMPLFTDFRLTQHPGLFDWYTLLVGGFAFGALAGHGALYLDWRTSGEVQDRSRRLAIRIWRSLAPIWLIVTVATMFVQPTIFPNLLSRTWSLVLWAMTIGGFCGVLHYLKRERSLSAFLCSSVFLLGLLATTMIGNYPHWLRSTIDPSLSLTAQNAASSRYGLSVALVWLSGGMLLAAGYFSILYRSIRGKVGADSGEGY